MWLHDFWRVGSSEAPHHITSCIPNVRPNSVVTFVDIVNESFVQNLYILIKSFRKEKSSSAKFS